MFRHTHMLHLIIFCVTLFARKWAANSRSRFHQAMMIPHFSYIHDIGAIPKINAAGERGFKSCLAAALGAQPILASIVEEFLPEDQLIPYIESVIRVFDRYGERNNRNKAR
jgi:hypothetical protein